VLLGKARRIVGGSLCTLGGKNIRANKAAPVKRGDRQPVRQSLVVPLRQCFELVVYFSVQRSLPPTRGTTACPTIVAHITKTDTCCRCRRILVFYSPNLVEGEFSDSQKLARAICKDATGPMSLRMPLGLTIHPAAQQAHQDVED
jgi:hypothetical protein